MVSKISTDGGGCGFIQSESLETTTIPGAGAISFPKYIVSGYHGGYSIAYWDGEETLSPMFNQNDPRCGSWAVVIKAANSDTLYLASYRPVVSNTAVMTIYKINYSQAAAGKFCPDTTPAMSFVIKGTPQPYINAVSQLGGDAFFLFTSEELVVFSPSADQKYIRRKDFPGGVNFKMSGHTAHALLTTGAGIVYVATLSDDEIVVTSQVSGIPAGLVNTSFQSWVSLPEGFVRYGIWAGPTTPVLSAKAYEWEYISQTWIPCPSEDVYASIYLKTYKISTDGVYSETGSTDLVEVPAGLAYEYEWFRYPDGTQHFGRRIENLYATSFTLTQGVASGIGGTKHTQVYGCQISTYIRGPPAEYGVSISMLYEPFSAHIGFIDPTVQFTTMGDFTGRAKHVNDGDQGTGSLLDSLGYDPKFGVQNTKDVVAGSPTAINFIKNEKNGAYAISPMLSTIYGIVPI